MKIKQNPQDSVMVLELSGKIMGGPDFDKFKEEIAKLVPFLLVIRHFPEFDEPIDGLVYAAVVAVGFASVENLLYLAYLPWTEHLARSLASPVNS